MVRISICGGLAAATLVGASVALASPAMAVDLDCDDFGSQLEAQATYNADKSDPHHLDADNDGKACEPSDYGTSAPKQPDEDSASKTPAEKPDEETASKTPAEKPEEETASKTPAEKPDADATNKTPVGGVSAGGGGTGHRDLGPAGLAILTGALITAAGGLALRCRQQG